MTRVMLTITQAADACGVSAKTIRRRLKAGEFEGAMQDGDGENAPWLIPIEALEVADGLTPNAPRLDPSDQPPIAAVIPDVSDALAELTERLGLAEAEAVEYRRRAEVAEAIADERAASLVDLRTALDMAQRQLLAGPTEAAPLPVRDVAAASSTRHSGHRWARLREALRRE